MNPQETTSSSSGDAPQGPNPSNRRPAIWLVSLVAAMVIAGGTFVWLEAQGRSGSPRIDWSKAEVTEFLLPNESRPVTLTFRSSQNVSNVAVTLTPSLSSVASATPASFASIQANRDYQVTLRLKAPQQSQVAFDGTLHLRRGVGAPSTYPEPLPIKMVVHTEPVPPDPGEAGKTTIEGIDSDADGLRDDIQRYIIASQLTSPSLRAGLSQAARVDQHLILSADSDRSVVINLANSSSRALACLRFLAGDAEVARRLYLDLQAELLDTRARSMAYVEADSKLSGKFFRLTAAVPDSCD